MYTPKHLTRWLEQVNYEGEDFNAYYVGAWRFFRCSPCERANFRYIRDHLADCADQTGIEEPVFTDEVMTLRYYVLIHESNERALRMADMFAERVKRKGSLDPEAEAKIDASAIQRHWCQCELMGRMLLCAEAGISIFAARRNKMPDNADLVALISEL